MSESPKPADALRTLPQIQDVNSDLQLKNPELRVSIDRNRAAALGVSPHQIDLALQSAYGSIRAAIKRFGYCFHVRMIDGAIYLDRGFKH